MNKSLYRFQLIVVFFICLPILGQGQAYNVSTFAGGAWHDGPALEAKFNSPGRIALDNNGNVFVADVQNNRIRKISSDGRVTTLAGSGANDFGYRSYSFMDGIGADARFGNPSGLTIDLYGNLYVADSENQRIRKIDQNGLVTTIAGSGAFGNSDGIGSRASFRNPTNLAIDRMGNLYILDIGNYTIRKVTPNGVVSSLAGSISSGFADGTGTEARFNRLNDLVVDGFGNVYVADDDRIRKITPAGVVTTFNSSGMIENFNNLEALAFDETGNLFVVDGDIIRKISPNGEITTIAGSVNQFGYGGYADGLGTSALFRNPTDIAVDNSGNLYVADEGNARIRKISPTGIVTTLAGSGSQDRYGSGYSDGTGTAAYFRLPSGIAADITGNLYVADKDNHCIRKISNTAAVTTLAGLREEDQYGNGYGGYVDGIGTTARFSGPTGVAVDATGNVYVADAGNNRIRKISPTGLVTTLAGSSYGYADGVGASASFSYPKGVAVDGNGNVYVADAGNNRVRKVSPSGEVSTLAGSGNESFADGVGIYASFNRLADLTVDGAGNIYVGDWGNHRIRKINPNGIVSTLAYIFNGSYGVEVDVSGNVYVAEYGSSNNNISKISPSGEISRIAGIDKRGLADGIGNTAGFYRPSSLALDGVGNIFVTDEGNHVIRKITNTQITSIDKLSINAPKLKLCPNPTTGIVTLTTSPEAESIAITNAVGQLVFTTKAQPEMELNLSHLKTGVYMVQVQSNKGVSTQRLVIQ